MKSVERMTHIVKTEGLGSLFQKLRRRISVAVYKADLSFPRTPAVEAELDQISHQLRMILSESRLASLDPKVQQTIAGFAPWFQRIEVPGSGITTTSYPGWAVYDSAPDNTLEGRLTPIEAAQLRPLPKWQFIKSRLPSIKDATVLEVGSNNGFFSFEFAKMGAREVNGLEAIQEDWTRSNFLLGLFGFRNVHFELDDWCFSQAAERYDIVFSSSVLDHLLFPFYGIYKMLAAARRFVILDYTVSWDDRAVCSLSFFPEHTRYHSFRLSDRMVLDFLVRCGIERDAVKRHPYGSRCLYIIDVGGCVLRGRLESADDPQWSGKFDFSQASASMTKRR